MNTFTIAALTVLLFFGGWRWPDMPFEGALHTSLSVAWFLVKTYAVVLVIFWVRGTYPRLRIDQLMALGWKLLVPLSFVNIVLTGVVLFYEWPLWTLTVLFSGTAGRHFLSDRRPPGQPTVADDGHAAPCARGAVAGPCLAWLIDRGRG